MKNCNFLSGSNPIAATFYFVFNLDVAITDKPTINTTIAGAELSVGSPDKSIHIDKAIQMIPITNLNLNTFQLRLK